MRGLKSAGNFCRLSCAYCTPAGFLSDSQLSDGELKILSCNFPFAEVQPEVLATFGKALLHARLPRAIFLKSALELKRAGVMPLIVIDRVGLPIGELSLALERLGMSFEFFVLALKSQDLRAILNDLPFGAKVKVYFSETTYPDFYSVDELPFLLREIGESFRIISFGGSDYPYLNSLLEKDYKECLELVGGNKKIRRLMVRVYRGGILFAPLRMIFSLLASLIWSFLDPGRFSHSVREALRESYWSYYRFRTQVWGLYLVKPFGNFVLKPIGDYVLNPFGNYVLKPIGDYVLNPFGNYVLKPIGDYVLNPFGNYVLKPIGDYVIGPIGHRLPNFIERNSVQGFWRVVEFGRVVRWWLFRPGWKVYYFCRYQFCKRILQYTVEQDRRKLD